MAPTNNNMNRYKYKMCNFIGNCKDGVNCRFAHSLNQLHPSKRPAKAKPVYTPPPQKVKRVRAKTAHNTKKASMQDMFDSDSDSDSDTASDDETVVKPTPVDTVDNVGDTASDDETVFAPIVDTASDDLTDETDEWETADIPIFAIPTDTDEFVPTDNATNCYASWAATSCVYTGTQKTSTPVAPKMSVVQTTDKPFTKKKKKFTPTYLGRSKDVKDYNRCAVKNGQKVVTVPDKKVDEVDHLETTTPIHSIMTEMSSIPSVVATVDTTVAGGHLCIEYDGDCRSQVVAAIEKIGFGVRLVEAQQPAPHTPVYPEPHSMTPAEEDAEEDKLYGFHLEHIDLEERRKKGGCTTFNDTIAKCYEYRSLVRSGKAPQTAWLLESGIEFRPHERKLIHEMATDCRLFTSSFTDRCKNRIISMQHVPFAGQ